MNPTTIEIKAKLQPEVSFDNTAIAYASLSNRGLWKSYAIFALMNHNLLVKLGTFLIKTAIKWHFPVKSSIKSTIFGQFCGGESIDSCQQTIDNLAKGNVFTILDYSVEGEDNEVDFDKTAAEIKRTIQKAAQESKIAFAVFKVSGLGSIEMMTKLQAGEALNDAEKLAMERTKSRVASIAVEASKFNVKLFFDAEETWIQNVIDELAISHMKTYNINGKTIIFNTYQMYRIESINNIKSIVQIADNEGFTVGVKLVRGAYMEKERKRATERNYPDPMQPNKAATDKDFDEAMLFLLKNKAKMNLCLGTHNQESSLLCAEKMTELGIAANDDAIWFAQLLGMSDTISFNLANAGYNVAKYVPYGPVEAVMPYLIRRAEENTSVAGQTSREFTLIQKEVRRRRNLIKS